MAGSNKTVAFGSTCGASNAGTIEDMPARPISSKKKRDVGGNPILGQSGLEASVDDEEPEKENEGKEEMENNMQEASKRDIETMVLPDLRQALRQRGLNPAGSKNILAERLWNAISEGKADPMYVKKDPAYGLSTKEAMNQPIHAGSNPNTNNFVGGRPTHKIMAEPGGASSVKLEHSSDAAPPPTNPASERFQRAMYSSSIFDDGSPTHISSHKASANKISQLEGSANVTTANVEDSEPLKETVKQHGADQLHGSDESQKGRRHLSAKKEEEMLGHYPLASDDPEEGEKDVARPGGKPLSSKKEEDICGHGVLFSEDGATEDPAQFRPGKSNLQRPGGRDSVQLG